MGRRSILRQRYKTSGCEVHQEQPHLPIRNYKQDHYKNGSNLNNKMMKELCEEFKIEHHNSSSYRPKMNGAVEAANKNIKKIVQKMVITYKDWHEMLPFALH